MRVGVIRAEFVVPGARSLKEKRHAIRSVKDRLRSRFNVSVAEVDHHDKWQRSALGIAVVAADGAYLSGEIDRCVDFLRTSPRAQLVSHEVETF